MIPGSVIVDTENLKDVALCLWTARKGLNYTAVRITCGSLFTMF